MLWNVQNVFVWPLCSLFLYLLFHCDPVVMGIFHIPVECIALFGVFAAIQMHIQIESEGMPREFWHFPVAESRSQTERAVSDRKMYFIFSLSIAKK